MTKYEEAVEAVKRADHLTAVVACTQAIEMGEDVAKAHLLRATLLYQLHRKEDAMEDMKKALELDPSLLSTMNGEFKMN